MYFKQSVYIIVWVTSETLEEYLLLVKFKILNMTTNEIQNKILNFSKELKNDTTPLAQKYRILFSLRNLKCKPSLSALIDALNDKSNLFRHDICFCLGKITNIINQLLLNFH